MRSADSSNPPAAASALPAFEPEALIAAARRQTGPRCSDTTKLRHLIAADRLLQKTDRIVGVS